MPPTLNSKLFRLAYFLRLISENLAGMEKKKQLWWQKEIIYEAYPRSFYDANNDGIGDLKGIQAKLSYLKWLGVKVLWLPPIYNSPLADFGYDVSDFKSIHPDYGTMADFDGLLKELHAEGMKLILDFIPNHTSDQHPWFLESRSSRNNPKRNWYLWYDAKEGGPEPNNWVSSFGGSAWEWDEPTQQFYYHGFSKEQPDLNWRNPEVQEAMLDVMKFWLDKGVDGFRMDAIWHIIKDDQIRFNPMNPEAAPEKGPSDKLVHVYTSDQPEVQPIVADMRKLLDKYDERMMVGETYLHHHQTRAYFGQNQHEGVHMMFNFLLIKGEWKAKMLASQIAEYDMSIPQGEWPNWVCGNHDIPRIADKVGVEQARNAAILLLTLRGTPFLFYGEELGMRGVSIPHEEVLDPVGKQEEGNFGRDPMRTPMQWGTSPYAGFSKSKPWLRVDKRYKTLNVDVEKEDKYSFLSLYRKLIALRQTEPSFYKGGHYPVYADEHVIAYVRKDGDSQAFLIVLNLTHRPCYFQPPKGHYKGTVEIATYADLEGMAFENGYNLCGDEGIVVRLA